jgi:hypothetical protein
MEPGRASTPKPTAPTDPSFCFVGALYVAWVFFTWVYFLLEPFLFFLIHPGPNAQEILIMALTVLHSSRKVNLALFGKSMIGSKPQESAKETPPSPS